MVQGLRLHASNVGRAGLIPGQETRYHMPCCEAIVIIIKSQNGILKNDLPLALKKASRNKGQLRHGATGTVPLVSRGVNRWNCYGETVPSNP